MGRYGGSAKILIKQNTVDQIAPAGLALHYYGGQIRPHVKSKSDDSGPAIEM